MGKIIRRSAVKAMGAFLASTAVAAPRRGARPNLYACEGCEAVHEVSPDRLSPSVDLAGADEPGERLILTGRVLSADTRTPVGDVVVYAHHTNAEGLYAKGSNKSEASHRHGRLRGWAKTGPDGVYTFRTIKPAPYPDMTMPAHIHLMIGEPGRRPYYIDDVVFEGEFGVTKRYRAAQEFRGGSGIVKATRAPDGVWHARRDVLLELHP